MGKDICINTGACIRAHLLVVDINADKQFVNTVLKPFETLPYRPRNKSDAWYTIP